MVVDALANTSRAAHDVGLAAWLGGSMFGKFALSPSLEKITSHTERGSAQTSHSRPPAGRAKLRLPVRTRAEPAVDRLRPGHHGRARGPAATPGSRDPARPELERTH